MENLSISINNKYHWAVALVGHTLWNLPNQIQIETNRPAVASMTIYWTMWTPSDELGTMLRSVDTLHARFLWYTSQAQRNKNKTLYRAVKNDKAVSQT